MSLKKAQKVESDVELRGYRDSELYKYVFVCRKGNEIKLLGGKRKNWNICIFKLYKKESERKRREEILNRKRGREKEKEKGSNGTIQCSKIKRGRSWTICTPYKHLGVGEMRFSTLGVVGESLWDLPLILLVTLFITAVIWWNCIYCCHPL